MPCDFGWQICRKMAQKQNTATFLAATCANPVVTLVLSTHPVETSLVTQTDSGPTAPEIHGSPGIDASFHGNGAAGLDGDPNNERAAERRVRHEPSREASPRYSRWAAC